MNDYKIIGVDLAKKKFHLVAFDESQKIVFKGGMKREDFFEWAQGLQDQFFVMEACSGSHYTAQILQGFGHRVCLLKPRDVKAFAKSRQKNDLNDAIAICRAGLDETLKRVHIKNKQEQEISYLHRARQNAIRQRIQRSNSLMTSLQEFGYIVSCGKSAFAKRCKEVIAQALNEQFISTIVYQQMVRDCEEIEALLVREKEIDRLILQENRDNPQTHLLQTIPGIGPINASILSNKCMADYESPKDFAASLGLVPRQHTTGGHIRLGAISKQGDRYARTMLIQGARSIVMRLYKPNPPKTKLYQFAQHLRESGKSFNLVCVAVANKLARISYACTMAQTSYRA